MNPQQLVNTYVRIPGSPYPPVKVTYHTVAEEWEVVETYTFTPNRYTFTVFAGFRYDLASVPAVAWPLIAPFDLSLVAPLMHDFIYQHGGNLPAGSVTPLHVFTRDETDDLFAELMKGEGVAAWRRVLAYWAVRAFAGAAWKE